MPAGRHLWHLGVWHDHYRRRAQLSSGESVLPQGGRLPPSLNILAYFAFLSYLLSNEGDYNVSHCQQLTGMHIQVNMLCLPLLACCKWFCWKGSWLPLLAGWSVICGVQVSSGSSIAIWSEPLVVGGLFECLHVSCRKQCSWDTISRTWHATASQVSHSLLIFLLPQTYDHWPATIGLFSLLKNTGKDSPQAAS